MMDEKWMDVVCALAEKMSRGEMLNIREQELYEDIQEDAESYRVFCLYTALNDFPAFYLDGDRENVELLYRDKNKMQMKELQIDR